MLLIHSSRSTKERTGHRSWKLLLAGIILPGLCLALFWHSASVSAAVINDPSEYPNVGTSDTFTPGGSNFDGNPNIGAAAMINNISGAASYLYQKDGTKSYDTYDAGKVPIPNTCGNQLGYPTVGNNICWWAQRSEG